jgi:hypothetical protein
MAGIMHKKSLNQEIRKKNSEKIATDNLALFKRLRSRTPVYSSQKWTREWKETEKLIQNVSEFPKITPLPRAKVRFYLEQV